MENIELVKSFESHSDLYECSPNGFFIEGGPIFLVGHYFLIEVSIIKKFHYDAEWGDLYHRELASIKECLYPTMKGELMEARILT